MDDLLKNKDDRITHYLDGSEMHSLENDDNCHAIHLIYFDWQNMYDQFGIKLKKMRLYHQMVDESISKGIKPAIALFNQNTPEFLRMIGGWQNREIIQHALDFAECVFQEFGHKVTHWLTFYDYPFNESGERDYYASHHQLVTHGRCVELYKTLILPGKIGLMLQVNSPNVESRISDIQGNNTSNPMDTWYLDPIYFGEYPPTIFQHFNDNAIEIGQDDLKNISNRMDYLAFHIILDNENRLDALSRTIEWVKNYYLENNFYYTF